MHLQDEEVADEDLRIVLAVIDRLEKERGSGSTSTADLRQEVTYSDDELGLILAIANRREFARVVANEHQDWTVTDKGYAFIAAGTAATPTPPTAPVSRSPAASPMPGMRC